MSTLTVFPVILAGPATVAAAWAAANLDAGVRWLLIESDMDTAAVRVYRLDSAVVPV